MKIHLIGLLAALYFAAVSAPNARAANTVLILDSEPCEFIGAGGHFYHTVADGTFRAVKNHLNGVSIEFRNATLNWSLDFSAPGNALLQQGVYEGAARYDIPSTVGPGLDISGNARGCNDLSGSFEVKEIVYGEDNTIVSFHATFSQRCSGEWAPWLTGEVLFQATAALPAEHRILSPPTIQGTEGQFFFYQIKSSKLNPIYGAENLPAGLAVSPLSGVIFGTPAVRGTFPVTIFADHPAGRAAQTLTVTIAPPGESVGPFTGIQFNGDKGDFIDGDRDSVYRSDDGIFSATKNLDGGVTVELHNCGPLWTLEFAPPQGQQFTVGKYPGAVALHYQDPQEPALSVSGNGRACGYSTGEFEVKEVSIDPGGRVTSFHATFEQHCGTNPDGLRGTVWYKAQGAITSSLNMFARPGHPFLYQMVANNQPSSYGAEGLPPGLSIDSQTGIISGTPTEVGDFRVTLSATGPKTTATDILNLSVNAPPSLGNLSTRAEVGKGDDVLIGGFIVPGGGRRMILRAIGPSLGQFGVQGALADPTMELFKSGEGLIGSNDDWRATQLGGVITEQQEGDIYISGLAPTHDLESAMRVTLTGGSYTVVVRGLNDSTGTGLVELYDLDSASTARLGNISSRGNIESAENVMIGGFIASGGSGGDAKVLLRAIGPSLASFGVANALQDPVLTLHDVNGTIIASNDDWKESQEAEIKATTLAPTHDAESAIVISRPQGSTTAVLRGKDGSTGVALLEVYSLQ